MHKGVKRSHDQDLFSAATGQGDVPTTLPFRDMPALLAYCS